MFQPLNLRPTIGDNMLVQILLNWASQSVRLVIASHRQLTVPNTMLVKENVLVLCAGYVLVVIQKLCGQHTAHRLRTLMTIGIGFCF